MHCLALLFWYLQSSKAVLFDVLKFGQLISDLMMGQSLHARQWCFSTATVVYQKIVTSLLFDIPYMALAIFFRQKKLHMLTNDRNSCFGVISSIKSYKITHLSYSRLSLSQRASLCFCQSFPCLQVVRRTTSSEL